MSLYYILFTCMDFDHLFFEKVCSNLIKLSLLCFFFSSIIFYFFSIFCFFCFQQCKDNFSQSFRVMARVGGQFSSGTIVFQNRFYRWKKGDFLHANEMLGFIYLLSVQSCTFLQILNGVSQMMPLYLKPKVLQTGSPN